MNTILIILCSCLFLIQLGLILRYFNIEKNNDWNFLGQGGLVNLIAYPIMVWIMFLMWKESENYYKKIVEKNKIEQKYSPTYTSEKGDTLFTRVK